MALSKRSRKEHSGGRMTAEEAELHLQEALDICAKFADHYKIVLSNFSFSPEDTSLEKIVGAAMRKTKYNPLYSNIRSMHKVGARMLYAAISQAANLEPKFNVSGCSLWVHGWDKQVRCYHGSIMAMKENTVELAPSSEAGVTALKEGRGVLTTGKWGRQAVKVCNPHYAVCTEDLDQRCGSYCNSSCGLSFTDAHKAITALKNYNALTAVLFPKQKADHFMLILDACDCTYGNKSVLGRQIPRMTPFSVTGLNDISPQALESTKKPFAKYPAVMVFQCCNYNQKKGSTCDIKISSPDLLFLLTLVRACWKEVMNTAMPIRFQHFKWSPEKQVKNVLLPDAISCMDDLPFGEAPSPKKLRLQEEPLSVDSDSDQTIIDD
ncbi:DNA-binding protein [Psittacine adenovirus 3]|uniref:DNA-binding protein n=1 Tax=Psittacine adenovirus 3 TaxID=1580497 RepID=A0A0A7JW83_9ADEN|nr:DNA-binding protein [Psittacine adenovirus 3]AIZ35775.1 DNA-binding protein [Psittacine adenovirus 3]